MSACYIFVEDVMFLQILPFLVFVYVRHPRWGYRMAGIYICEVPQKLYIVLLGVL